MKLNDVKVGARYVATVSKVRTIVRVVAIERRTRIRVVNDETGKRITLRSPQRLLEPVDQDPWP